MMQALQEAEKLAAGVLDDDSKVEFEVRLQQFLEMLSGEPSTSQQLEAMTFARTTLNRCAKDCPNQDQDAMLSVCMPPFILRIYLPCMHCPVRVPPIERTALHRCGIKHCRAGMVLHCAEVGKTLLRIR